MGILRLLVLFGGLFFLGPMTGNAKITLYSDNSGKVHITDKEMTGSEAPQGHPLLGNPQGLPNLRRHQPAPPPPSTPRGTEPPSASPSPKNRRRQIASHLKNTVNFINTSAEPTGPSTPFAKPVAQSVTKPLTRVARARHKAIELLENSIRISQNEQGVLVITNLPEKDSERPIMTAFGKKRHNASSPPDSPVFSGDSPLYGQIIPAAYNPNPVRSFSTAVEEGPIRRYRDKNGVVRICNVDPARRSNLPAASPPPMATGVPLPLTSGPSPPTGIGGATADRSKAEVVVHRDRGGRVRIFTKEPERQLLACGPTPPTLEKIDPALAPIVTEAANAYQLPPSLILSVIRLESNFVPWAVSPKGAMGLMQLMPGTAADLGVQDPFCPRQNIMGGSRYLRQMLNCFDGSLPLAVAAYNAGPNRVVAAGHQVPEIKETKQFVSQVLGLQCLLEKMLLPRLPK